MNLPGIEISALELESRQMTQRSQFFLVGPIVLIFLMATVFATRFSYQKQGVDQNISSYMLIVVRVWSCLLMLMCFVAEVFGDRISLPHMALTIIIAGSGLLINNEHAQLIFHICTTCSWFGIFDMFVRSNPGFSVSFFLKPGWTIAFFIATAPILRVHLGFKWQIQNVALMSIGLVILLAYFWIVELPSCAYLESSNICDVMGTAPSRFAEAYFDYDYRIIGMVLAVLIHGIHALLLLIISQDQFGDSDECGEAVGDLGKYSRLSPSININNSNYSPSDNRCGGGNSFHAGSGSGGGSQGNMIFRTSSTKSSLSCATVCSVSSTSTSSSLGSDAWNTNPSSIHPTSSIFSQRANQKQQQQQQQLGSSHFVCPQGYSTSSFLGPFCPYQSNNINHSSGLSETAVSLKSKEAALLAPNPSASHGYRDGGEYHTQNSTEKYCSEPKSIFYTSNPTVAAVEGETSQTSLPSTTLSLRDNYDSLTSIGTSGKTATEDVNKNITVPGVRVSMGHIHLPDDSIEITEAEAIQIVEKGLRKFKTKRAT